MSDATYSFGTWVRLRRQALVLTREELAGRVGCAEVTIRKIESDERKPSPQIAELLAYHLGLPTDQRDLFVRVARGLLAVEQLPPPIPGALVASITNPVVQKSPDPILPRGTITFLFTDIEGSTKRWEQQPEAMRGALARHNAILRQAMTAHDGHVFKTIGDAFCAAFAAAPDALAAAIAGQRALVAEDWGVIGPLRVRMALHTGTAEPQDGDYFGQPLNRVARLLAAGYGGQILISLAAHELVRDHLPEGASLRDLGSYRLKDLREAETIFQFVDPQLPAIFPPLMTAPIRQDTLLLPPTELIGREHEIETICALLQRNTTRLVTLTGPGGIGKTRLALEVANVMHDAFDDGIVFVNLAPISDANLVLPTIAQALEVREVAGQSLMACLVTFLKQQQLLLVLDNVEQVIAIAPQIGELLATSERVNILATSRMLLHLRGEHEYIVPPLVLPDPQTAASLETVAQAAAMQLFLQRAREARATFMLTPANAPLLVDICIQLDGLPLAIELAAARIKLLSPAALRDRLHDRLAILTGGARDLPVRQQTLRGTIAWSYDLLDPLHQRLFSRLGVFANGCSLEAAATICQLPNEPPWDPLDALTVLVNSSMVQCLEAETDAPRFVLLETLRAYALEQLEAAGHTQIMVQQHANYYVTLAETADPELRGAHQQQWLQRLEAERDNLRIALAWALNGGDMEVGVRLAIGLWQFWEQGYGSEGRTWLNRAAAGSSGVAHALRARVLLRGGWFGAGDQATALVEESLALFRELGDRGNMAWAMTKMGHHAWLRSEYIQAITFLEQSLAIFRELDDSRGIASTLHLLGDATRDCGELQRAITALEESVARFRALDDRGSLAFALNGLGDAYYNQDNLVRADTCFQEAAARCEQVGNRYGLPWALRNLGRVAYVQHQTAQAQLLLEDTVARFRSMGHRTGLAWSLHHLSATLLLQNDESAACISLTEALELQSIERNKRLIVESLERCVMMFVRQHAFVQAARIGGAAEGLHEREHLPLARADKAIYEREIASLRAQLLTSRLATAWAAGRTLTWEQAVDEALRWLRNRAASADH